jgi:hypothetical protein
MLLVQLWIDSTRDVWKFAKLDSPRRLVVLLIRNCTRHRMITFTNLLTIKNTITYDSLKVTAYL